MWRLVLAKVASLEELDSSWSLDDLIRGNMALSVQEYAEGAE